MSKALYNSELVKRGEVALKVLSDVKQSKFQGKPDYIFVELDGQERSLNAENADYLDPLILHKNDVVTVKATGSHEDAKLEVSGGNGATVNAPKQAQPHNEAKPASDSKPQAGSTFESYADALAKPIARPVQERANFWDTYKKNFMASGDAHALLISQKDAEAMEPVDYWSLVQRAAITATINECRH